MSRDGAPASNDGLAKAEAVRLLRACVHYWPAAMNDDMQDRTWNEARVFIESLDAGQDAARPAPSGYPKDIQNPDHWRAFLARYMDNRATNGVHDGIGLVALYITDAINRSSAAAPSDIAALASIVERMAMRELPSNDDLLALRRMQVRT